MILMYMQKKSRENSETYIDGGYLAELTGILQRQKNSHFTSKCNFFKVSQSSQLTTSWIWEFKVF